MNGSGGSSALRLGLVGCGGRGLHLGRELRETGLGCVTGLCDLNEDNLRKGRVWHADARVARDLHELASWPDVDALLIATPDASHVPIALDLKAYGKPLLVEKPLATTREDCDGVVRAFEPEAARGLYPFVGLCMRYNNFTRRIHQLVTQGAIGEVRLAHCIDHVSPGGRMFFHRPIRSRKRDVTGLLVQKGCHSLDFISWILGARPVRVHCFAGLDYYGGEEPDEKVCHTCSEFETCAERIEQFERYDFMNEKMRVADFCAFRREIDVHDSAVVNVLYENGAKLSYAECHFSSEYVREFTFVGTEGQLYARGTKTDGKRPEIFLAFRQQPGKVVHEIVELAPGGHGGGDRGMLREFASALLERRRPLTDLHAGRESSYLAIAAERSAESGQIVDIPNVDGHPRSVQQTKGRARHLGRASAQEV